MRRQNGQNQYEIARKQGEVYNYGMNSSRFLRKDRRIGTVLNHADDLATIHEPIQALRADLPIGTLSSDKLVPPLEQKVTSDELEPRRKDVV